MLNGFTFHTLRQRDCCRNLFTARVYRTPPAMPPMCIITLLPFSISPLSSPLVFLAANHLTTQQAFLQMCVFPLTPQLSTQPCSLSMRLCVSVYICECVSQLASRGRKTQW